MDKYYIKNYRFISNLIIKTPHVRTDFESNLKTKGCPAFKEERYLTPYVDVIPCPFIHITLENAGCYHIDSPYSRLDTRSLQFLAGPLPKQYYWSFHQIKAYKTKHYYTH